MVQVAEDRTHDEPPWRSSPDVDDVALLSRDTARIERAAAGLHATYGVRALGIPTDVADFDAVDAAASRVEREIGPIEVWRSTLPWRHTCDGNGRPDDEWRGTDHRFHA